MKVKILKSSGWYKGLEFNEFEVDRYDLTSPADLRFSAFNHGWIYSCDCVITELPESFCVKICDDIEKWKKFIGWLNKTYKSTIDGDEFYHYGVFKKGVVFSDTSFETEIHIDDMIKYIDYMERHIKGGEQFHKESQLTVKMNMEKILKTQQELINLLYSQVVDLSMMSKIEFGDDVIEEIIKLQNKIKNGRNLH